MCPCTFCAALLTCAAGAEPELLLSGGGATGDVCRAERAVQGLSARWAFLLLLAARLASARLNLVHDCDEVYNYWEPLHFLLYGSGMQTWEYRCRCAARHLPGSSRTGDPTSIEMLQAASRGCCTAAALALQ